MKRITALFTAVLLAFSFASCEKKDTVEQTSAATDSFSEEYIPDESVNAEANIPVQKSPVPEVTPDSNEATSETTTVNTVDPSQWTDEEIIEFYKAAAEKTNPKAKSKQIMVLEELIINDGDGALGFFIKILEPAIASVIKKNELEFDGITGGFGGLTADDAQSIKAYKSGEYTVVEMKMKPQTDPIHADQYAGTVGHAITVLGDIGRVIAEFPQFDVDVENADIAIHYVNATVKVKINKDGYIEKGTWKYTCDPEIKHLEISGIMIDKADAKIDYIITVGGGF